MAAHDHKRIGQTEVADLLAEIANMTHAEIQRNPTIAVFALKLQLLLAAFNDGRSEAYYNRFESKLNVSIEA